LFVVDIETMHVQNCPLFDATNYDQPIRRITSIWLQLLFPAKVLKLYQLNQSVNQNYVLNIRSGDVWPQKEIEMSLRRLHGHSFFEAWFQERLCGILVNEVKSRVHGAANLTVPMHQYQLRAFVSKFSLILCQSTPSSTSFKADNSDSAYLFLAPRKCSRKLIDLQFKHLEQHYKTGHKIPSIQDCPDLVHMDHNIDVWYPCFINNVVYHCDEYQRRWRKSLFRWWTRNDGKAFASCTEEIKMENTFRIA